MQERLPRSTGEIISDAMAILRRHIKPFCLLSMPFCAAELILREAGQSTFQRIQQGLTGSSNMDMEHLVQTVVGAAGGLGMFLGSVVLTQLLSAALIASTKAAWDGAEPRADRALSAVGSRGAALLVTFVVLTMQIVGLAVLACLAIGAAALAEPLLGVGVGVLALIGLVVAFILLSLRWGLFAQTVVLEGLRGMRALARSSALTAGRGLPFTDSPKFRLSVLLLVTFAIAGTMQTLFTIPRLVMGFATRWSIGDAGLPPLASMPIWFIIPFAVLEVALNSVVNPFASILVTLFYLDLRVRYEAIDFEPKPALGGSAS